MLLFSNGYTAHQHNCNPKQSLSQEDHNGFGNRIGLISSSLTGKGESMKIEKNAATIILDGGKEFHANVITDSMGEKSIDITRLRKETGYITYDPGFVNTGGLLRY